MQNEGLRLFKHAKGISEFDLKQISWKNRKLTILSLKQSPRLSWQHHTWTEHLQIFSTITKTENYLDLSTFNEVLAKMLEKSCLSVG